MALTDVAIKNAKAKPRQYKLTDGNGLYLLVKPGGGKYWRFKYYWHQKEKLLALGVYPTLSLADARLKRNEAKKLLADDIDPGQLKKKKKQEAITKSQNTFEKLAREWHSSKLPSWTPRYARGMMRRMEADLFPRIGKQPIQSISAPDLLAVIREIEARGATDISHRMLQAASAVFTYAIASGKAERNPATDLKGALKSHKTKHYAHLKENELPDFLDALSAYDGHPQTRLAIQLLMLTFVRTTELRGAEWREIDFAKKEWRIPAERMKMRTEHIVPLSRQAIAILREMETLSGDGDFVFPHSNNPSKMMSNNTMIYAIYRMGYHSRTTAHGFRALASTILNEQGYRPDVIERQLAHAERNKVRASYNHAQYLPERRSMMQEWADYLDLKRVE